MEKDLRKLSQARSGGVFEELWGYMGETKKWWLTPIVLMLLLLGALIVIGGSGGAPFIYTLF